MHAPRRSDVTLKQVRRLLEGDLGLPSGALDTAELKESIKTQVDAVRQTPRRELSADRHLRGAGRQPCVVAN